MRTDELDYHLPPQLIAQHPLPDRAQSRLLVLDRARPDLQHRRFSDIIDYLNPGDCLVLNQTRVIPARFYIRRGTGGRIEGLFLHLSQQNHWVCLLKNASRLRFGETVALVPAVPGTELPPRVPADLPDRPQLKVSDRTPEGHWLLEPLFTEDHHDILSRFGTTPLPPYIRREGADPADRQRYQTVYARTPGSVAAPTAGLHFTPDLLERLRRQGIGIAYLTLHVGLGTFKPITAETLDQHIMHHETYHLDEPNAAIINTALEESRRVVAVGTTSVRTLESVAENRRVRPGAGQTNLYITPGCRFQIISALITNFHLPRSTLLALVCAFAGTQRTLEAYRQAVDHHYRFYSYGDAMLVV